MNGPGRLASPANPSLPGPFIPLAQQTRASTANLEIGASGIVPGRKMDLAGDEREKLLLGCLLPYV